MNNEPVAWMSIQTDEEGEFRVYNDTEPEWDNTFIPLYTHPVKELTDEEIIDCAGEAGFKWSEAKGIFVRHSNCNFKRP